MPDLAKLQKELGGPGFEVVALSLDRKGADASSAFLKETGAENLALYTDSESKALVAVNALGLPATLLIDKDGKEAARLLGPANWASDEAKAMIRALMK
jgi:thiol-disulfide isomerase/thioredoxin